MTPKILLLEDDINLSDIIYEYLVEVGYIVDCVYDAKECIDRTFDNKYDIFLFDVKIPFQNGFELLNELRNAGISTPTIFTTSLNSIDDVIKGYKVGGDDYLKKPFELKELHLRIESLLKREFTNRIHNRVEIKDKLFFDIDTNSLIINEDRLPLANKEGRILRLLIKNRDKVVSHQLIFTEAWDDEEASELSLRTYIKNIRKIVGKEMIENIRGIGYKLKK